MKWFIRIGICIVLICIVAFSGCADEEPELEETIKLTGYHGAIQKVYILEEDMTCYFAVSGNYNTTSMSCFEGRR